MQINKHGNLLSYCRVNIMQIFIDESGNLGKKGRFFVIAALAPDNPNRIKNIIKKCCLRFGKPDVLDEIKGEVLTFPRKQEILQKLNKKDDLRRHYVVADKKHIDPKLLKDNNLCFNYLASFLFKPILKGTNEDVEVIIDNRSVKVASKNSLQDYIKLKALTEWDFKREILFAYTDSKNSKNLQAIHLIANVVYGKYTYNTEHLYGIIGNKFVHKIEFPRYKFNT